MEPAFALCCQQHRELVGHADHAVHAEPDGDLSEVEPNAPVRDMGPDDSKYDAKARVAVAPSLKQATVDCAQVPSAILLLCLEDASLRGPFFVLFLACIHYLSFVYEFN